jgi:rhodanese-related sulfurtransferase
MKRAVLEMVLIVILGSAVGVGYNAVSPAQKKVPVKGSVSEAQGIQMLTLDEVRYYVDSQKGTVMVDARAPEEYGLGHIPGALNVPMDGFDASFQKQSASLKKATMVIVYCSGGSCNTSHEVANLLQKKGVRKLAIFTDGLPGWMKANLPIKNGPQP